MSRNNTGLKCLSRTGFISQYHRVADGKMTRQPRTWSAVRVILACSTEKGSSTATEPRSPRCWALFLQQTWGQGLNSCLSTHTQTHAGLLGAEANFPTMPGVVSLRVTSLSAVSVGENPICAGSSGAEILLSSLNTGSAGLDSMRDKLQQKCSLPNCNCHAVS